jgi:hypothetical protein
MKNLILVSALFAHVSCAADQVAVAVYANEPALKKYEKAVQARLEEILSDSGLQPLDEVKARQLRDNWVDLADPSHLITAEEIAAKAGKFEVKRIYRVSFNADASMPLGLYHSAAAQLQLRVVDKDAQVKASQSAPMGTKGFAASDAATPDAAIVNALQRAVDSVSEGAGLKVLAPVTARVVPLNLEAVAALPLGAEPLGGSAAAAKPVAAGWEAAAPLMSERWKREEASCQATSPDGGYGVVGTYAWSVDRLAKDNARKYGGYLHLVDVKDKKPVTQLTMHELGNRGAGENGSSAAIACSFLGSWRYLIAASGNRLACWDVERGRETCSVPISYTPEKATLRVLQAGSERFVELQSDRGRTAFKLTASGR